MAAAAVGDEVELEVGQLQPRDWQRRRQVGDLGGHRGGGGGHLVRLEQAYMTSTICLIDLDPLNPGLGVLTESFGFEFFEDPEVSNIVSIHTGGYVGAIFSI